MKLSAEEKTAIREAAKAPAESFAPPDGPGPAALSPKEYLCQVEQWAKCMPAPDKPVRFEGKAWRL